MSRETTDFVKLIAPSGAARITAAASPRRTHRYADQPIRCQQRLRRSVVAVPSATQEIAVNTLWRFK